MVAAVGTYTLNTEYSLSHARNIERYGFSLNEGFHGALLGLMGLQ